MLYLQRVCQPSRSWNLVSSSSSKHLSSHQKGLVRRKLQNPTKKSPLLSMADSTVNYGAHFIRKCPRVACNYATCLPPLVAQSCPYTWWNLLCMRNWMQHVSLRVLQLWTRVFLVMLWLQRTPLLKYHINRGWHIFSRAIDIDTIIT